MDQATVLPPHDTVWALGCPNIHPPLAQTRMESPMRRSSWTLARRGRWRSGGAVTVTTSAEAVDSSIGRLSHHRMMSDSVCAGLELVSDARKLVVHHRAHIQCFDVEAATAEHSSDASKNSEFIFDED